MVERIPVTIVTGFLGSGKTTLIANLLAHESLANTLVIVNEFGDVGIDHDLLEASSDDVVLLANGCLCCTIRGNLVDTLGDVFSQREAGRLRRFDRVIVETSGVADPAPLLAFLYSDAATMERYRIEGVVAVCDGLAEPGSFTLRRETASQILTADRLVISKCDLGDEARIDAVERGLREINPAASIHRVARGQIDPAALLQPDLDTLGGETRRRSAFVCEDASDHSGRFHVVVLRASRPLRGDEPDALLAAIRSHAGPRLLRLKGILRVEGRLEALVVQTALTAAHDPEWRGDAASASGRLVLISEGDPPEALIAALKPLGLAPVP